jgi:purine-nucleoside/S-methyl-5'-thioadenosine phosphorylase / adenosine deaminase
MRLVGLGGRVRGAFTDRHGGVSAPPYDARNLGGAVGDEPAAVARNRALTARELGLDPSRVVFMRQVHSATARYVTAPFDGEPPPLDAVYTDRPDLALAVLVADCAPVLLADPVAAVLGAAHSGRVGTALGVVPALIKGMIEVGGEPSRMAAAIGPAACGNCYEVTPELRDEMAAQLPAAWSTTSRGTPALDIRAGIRAQLAEAGITAIDQDARCTIETPSLYSYRRGSPTGRFAAYLWTAR